MSRYDNGAEHFGAGTHVHVPLQNRHTATAARSECHLLKQEAIDTYHCVGMNHDPVGMGHQKSASDIAC
ncbi:hypothetical protein GCM10010987_76110 [Bradyrhizobium guangdongense]|uniref:Uncharacterized protein n=1 Tax=Bradyrhizobium guangdongense TaxID=1325090 RepID=A0AA87WGK2_9BRAD|nr:hypothetical protein GCM10010987_76110 [Bradyrhizobium guangdongense]